MKARPPAGFVSKPHRVWFTLCAVCLAIYIACVTYFLRSAFLQSMAESVATLLLFAVLSVGLYFVLTRACVRLCGAAPVAGRRAGRLDKRVLLLALGISAAVFGCAFAACWPGGVSYDASNQWRQIASGEYNNWHPVAHTLLIGLFARAGYPVAVCVQIAVFSVAMAYLTATLHRHGVPGWLALGVHTLVCASLPVRNTLMYLGKDSAMTIGVLLLCTHAVRMLFTRGEWLKKPLNAVAFGLALAYTSLMRHNALAFTLPLALCALLCFAGNRRSGALVAAVMAVVVVVVQGPIIGALDVVYPANLVEESVGIPMTVLGDIKQRAPEALDAQTDAFLRMLATDEDWQSVYVAGNYNSIKFTYDREYIAQTPASEILSMALRSAASAPRTAFEAVTGVTDLVWDVSGQGEGYECISNSGDIEEARYGRAGLNKLGGMLLALVDAPLKWLPVQWLTENIGAQLLLLLLVTLWALYRRGVDVLLLALPTLLYDLATMFLLCGNDARFFQFTMAASLPMILALLYLPSAAGRTELEKGVK